MASVSRYTENHYGYSGVSPVEKELQIASMSFINAVTCGGPGQDPEFRMHVRYEFLNLGLTQLIDANLYLAFLL